MVSGAYLRQQAEILIRVASTNLVSSGQEFHFSVRRCGLFCCSGATFDSDPPPIEVVRLEVCL
jgi:hypothetical protein